MSPGELLLYTAALFGLFVCSAFFSSSEVALFSLQRNKIASHYENFPRALRYISFLLEHQRNLLITILLGNTIVNVGAAILAVTIVLSLADMFKIPQEIALTIQIFVLTGFILLFGEIIPKVAARKNSVLFARYFSYPLFWLNAFLFPISEFLSELFNSFVKIFKFKDRAGMLKGSDLKSITAIGKASGTLENKEHDLIQSVLEARELTVEEILTPRVQIVAISHEANLKKLVEVSLQTGHSRIPVYKSNIDSIIGLIYTKDLIPLIGDMKNFEQYKCTRFIRPTMYVPRQKRVREMMVDFQEKKIHFAVVVDEFGGTLGVVTLEDVIQVLIGEDDANLRREDSSILKLREGVYEVDASTRLSLLVEYMNIDMAGEFSESDTIGGLITERAGKIPERGYTTELGNYRLTVLEKNQTKIDKIQFFKRS